MTESKGKWRITPDEAKRNWISGITDFETGETIADVLHKVAPLIVAAPEMFEFIKVVVREEEANGEYADTTLIAQGLALIAKAEGKEVA